MAAFLVEDDLEVQMAAEEKEVDAMAAFWVEDDMGVQMAVFGVEDGMGVKRVEFEEVE